MKKLNNTFINHIFSVMNKIFPILNIVDKKVLRDYVVDIIYVIGIKFNFIQDEKLFEKQFSQNNNRDIIAIINMLLPYVNNKDNYKLYRELDSFESLYTEKKNKFENDLSKNNYKYCNIQFNRHYNDEKLDINKIVKSDNKEKYSVLKDTIEKYLNNYNPKEDHYKEIYLEETYYFILQTIEQVANKLYVNWINVRPISLDNYKDTELYKNTFYYNSDENVNQFEVELEIYDEKEIQPLSWWNMKSDNMIMKFYRGLPINDIYNTITNDFYLSIKKIKWILFEFLINDKPILYIQILENIFGLDDILKDNEWDDISDKNKLIYEQKWDKIIDSVKNNTQLDKKYDNFIIRKFFINIIYFFE